LCKMLRMENNIILILILDWFGFKLITNSLYCPFFKYFNSAIGIF